MAPDSVWAPASRAFSSTAIDSGSPACVFCSCERRSAADDQDVDCKGLAFHGLRGNGENGGNGVNQHGGTEGTGHQTEIAMLTAAHSRGGGWSCEWVAVSMARPFVPRFPRSPV